MADLTAAAASRSPRATLAAAGGAVVVGADYRALGVVRSLGRRGIPVCVIGHDGERLALSSRYATQRIVFDGGMDELPDLLLDLGLPGWTVFPSSDESAASLARAHNRLSAVFRLTVPQWGVLRWAYDKRLSYRLADELGVPCPRTWYPHSRSDVETLELEYPVALKPAVKETFNRLTAAKAWRVDSRAELLERYDEACTLVDPDVLMVQELVPGTADGQLSFAALCRDGDVLASLTARRARQFPMDFGRASTFVESVHAPELATPSRALLARLRWTGLVEVEFMRDPRDGVPKLLDLNPRVWGWHTLGARAGVDFAWLTWLLARDGGVPRATGRAGVRWVRLSTDLPTALKEVLHRRLPLGDYLRSLRGPREGAIFARDDPLPGVLEGPLLALLVARRLVGGSGV